MRSLAMDHGVSLSINPGGKGLDTAHDGEIIKRILAKSHPDGTPASAHSPPALPSHTPPAVATSDPQRIIKDVRGTMPMTQPRAKHGEIGPNGEVYPGGAFIATQDLSKKMRDKLTKKATGRVQTRDGWANPEPGQMSIVDKLGGTVMNPRNGDINHRYLDYIDASPADRAMYADLSERHKGGQSWVSINEYPQLARLSDVARLYAAGLPVPGAALEVLPAEYRERLKKWTPKA